MKRTPAALKPIRFTARQVGIMVQVADFYDPQFAARIGEKGIAIDLCAQLIAKGFPAGCKWFMEL